MLGGRGPAQLAPGIEALQGLHRLGILLPVEVNAGPPQQGLAAHHRAGVFVQQPFQAREGAGLVADGLHEGQGIGEGLLPEGAVGVVVDQAAVGVQGLRGAAGALEGPGQGHQRLVAVAAPGEVFQVAAGAGGDLLRVAGLLCVAQVAPVAQLGHAVRGSLGLRGGGGQGEGQQHQRGAQGGARPPGPVAHQTAHCRFNA